MDKPDTGVGGDCLTIEAAENVQSNETEQKKRYKRNRTMVIDDGVYESARHEALRSHKSMSSLVEDLLREYVKIKNKHSDDTNEGREG